MAGSSVTQRPLDIDLQTAEAPELSSSVAKEMLSNITTFTAQNKLYDTRVSVI